MSQPSADSESAASTSLLDVRALNTVLRTPLGEVRAVNDVSLAVGTGECVGLVGESGSGKSMLAFSVIRLLPPGGIIESGEVLWRGRDLTRLPDEPLRRVRGREIAIVFQEPGSALNPVLTIGTQLMEPLRIHLGLSKRLARERAESLLEEVQIDRPRQRLSDYPHQLSGGMKQRVVIAMAIACDPALMIADEPTTALDATLQARILELLNELRQKRQLSLLLITHDLSILKDNADRVAVMYAGRLVEDSPTSQILVNPAHPYTEGLWASLPKARGREPGKSRLKAMPGRVPHLTSLPPGCAFEPRCPDRLDVCTGSVPELRPLESELHRVACYKHHAPAKVN